MVLFLFSSTPNLQIRILSDVYKRQHGMQALIFSQNQVNFATKWGFDMSNPESAAYAAGVAAVSTAIAWTGFGLSLIHISRSPWFLLE